MAQQPWQELAKTGGGELPNVKVIVTYPTGVAWRKSPSYNDRVTEFSGPRKDTVLNGSLVQGHNENVRYLKVGMPAGNRYGWQYVPMKTLDGKEICQILPQIVAPSAPTPTPPPPPTYAPAAPPPVTCAQPAPQTVIVQQPPPTTYVQPVPAAPATGYSAYAQQQAPQTVVAQQPPPTTYVQPVPAAPATGYSAYAQQQAPRTVVLQQQPTYVQQPPPQTTFVQQPANPAYMQQQLYTDLNRIQGGWNQGGQM